MEERGTRRRWCFSLASKERQVCWVKTRPGAYIHGELHLQQMDAKPYLDLQVNVTTPRLAYTPLAGLVISRQLRVVLGGLAVEARISASFPGNYSRSGLVPTLTGCGKSAGVVVLNSNSTAPLSPCSATSKSTSASTSSSCASDADMVIRSVFYSIPCALTLLIPLCFQFPMGRAKSRTFYLADDRLQRNQFL